MIRTRRKFNIPPDLIIVKQCLDNGGSVFFSQSRSLFGHKDIEVIDFKEYMKMAESHDVYYFDIMIFPLSEETKNHASKLL